MIIHLCSRTLIPSVVRHLSDGCVVPSGFSYRPEK